VLFRVVGSDWRLDRGLVAAPGLPLNRLVTVEGHVPAARPKLRRGLTLEVGPSASSGLSRYKPDGSVPRYFAFTFRPSWLVRTTPPLMYVLNVYTLVGFVLPTVCPESEPGSYLMLM
jgi:hypothetical protein